MNLLKKIYSFIFLSALFFSCEKDDTCLSPMTPKLILRFYDASDPGTIKSVANLSLIALPNNDTLINNEEKDSLSIPLNVNKNDCKFILAKGTNNDTISLSYVRKNIFVSKSCGYKTIFNDFQASIQSDNQNWMDYLKINTHKINIDTTAHVKIFH